MKKNMMVKNLFRSIMKSMGRYVAIVAIIALGAGLFVGLVTTKTDMIATGQEYLDKQNMFDLRLLNPYGWTDEDLDKIKNFDIVNEAEPVITIDAIGTMGSVDAESVYKLYAIPEHINKVSLRGGRMPQNSNECLADSLHASDDILGKTFTVSSTNDKDTLDSLVIKEFTVVGYVSSPLYMDMNRGSTTLGNGSVNAFVFLMPDAFQIESYTQIDITLHGSYDIYSKEYDAAMDKAAVELKPLLDPMVHARYAEVYKQANEAYAEGFNALQEGKNEYNSGLKQAEIQFAEAKIELHTAQAEIDSKSLLIADAEKKLQEGQELIDKGELELKSGKSLAYEQLSAASDELLKNEKLIQENLNTVNSALSQVESGLSQIESGITQLESGLSQLDFSIDLAKTMINVLDTSLSAASNALEYVQNQGIADEDVIAEMKARILELEQKKKEYEDQLIQLEADRINYGQQLDDLYVQKEELQKTKDELVASKNTLDAAMSEVRAGYAELDNSKLKLEAEFAAAEAALLSSKQLLDQQTLEFEEGKKALEDGRAQLFEGKKAYFEGLNETQNQLSEAYWELLKGHAELKQAADLIESMIDSDVYILNRNTNVGYLALDNNSDIVAGVSKVFPAFFLLVASLVCITTMTRMVEDERTQIGTLKALGYSNRSIISKYLIYAGSAAVTGCGVGVFVGSVIFPKILWNAYRLILNITPDIKIIFDLRLCFGVLLVYTVVILAVTWFCCRMILKDAPAELIRPKAPTSGKKILLEYLPFWNKMRFLNKVMFRNIFRYRQRLLMMLAGIGGCTALLVTGFGLGDSIMDIVAYQYEEVTVFDMQVQFANGQNAEQKKAFIHSLADQAEQIGFAHQSGVEIDFNNKTKSIYMIAADNSLENFYDLHKGDKELNMPAINQVLISKGTAEAMGIKAGDTVTLRNTDNQQLKLKVNDIFDNNVYNYAIVLPQTIEENWGYLPDEQIAYIKLPDGQDAHEVGAKIFENTDVMNVLISQDIADQVGSMLEALNMVVVTVIICAALLAVIVVYNLTNINISERIREIATIKVLGFNEVESAMYVFKENLLLSILGALLGLVGGKFLLEFVMSQIKIDMVWLDARILPISLIWSVVITIVTTLAVDFVLYFKMNKINMAEALKSVE